MDTLIKNLKDGGSQAGGQSQIQLSFTEGYGAGGTSMLMDPYIRRKKCLTSSGKGK